MRILIFIVLILYALVISCKDKTPKIDPNLIKNVWVSKKDNYGSKYLQIINDSLMIENITYGELPLSSYKISLDTLLIYSRYCNYQKSINNESPTFITRVFKFKVLKLDSLDLFLKPICLECKDTIFFSKIKQIKKNDLKIDKLEFSFCSNDPALPTQNIIIDKDSIFYHLGFATSSKHKALAKCKLDFAQFEMIQSKIYSVDRDSFILNTPPPGAGRFYLFVKSKNDSIEIEGVPRYSKENDLTILLDYLAFIEHTLKLEDNINDSIVFRDKWNTDRYGKNYR